MAFPDAALDRTDPFGHVFGRQVGHDVTSSREKTSRKISVKLWSKLGVGRHCSSSRHFDERFDWREGREIENIAAAVVPIGFKRGEPEFGVVISRPYRSSLSECIRRAAGALPISVSRSCASKFSVVGSTWRPKHAAAHQPGVDHHVRSACIAADDDRDHPIVTEPIDQSQLQPDRTRDRPSLPSNPPRCSGAWSG